VIVSVSSARLSRRICLPVVSRTAIQPKPSPLKGEPGLRQPRLDEGLEAGLGSPGTSNA